jgi:hypothetical protein
VNTDNTEEATAIEAFLFSLLFHKMPSMRKSISVDFARIVGSKQKSLRYASAGASLSSREIYSMSSDEDS